VENTTYDVIVIGKGLMGAAADRIDSGRVGMRVGGNGSSAQSADEIGRLGALVITHDEWAYDLEAHHFSAQFALAS